MVSNDPFRALVAGPGRVTAPCPGPYAAAVRADVTVGGRRVVTVGGRRVVTVDAAVNRPENLRRGAAGRGGRRAVVVPCQCPVRDPVPNQHHGRIGVRPIGT
jgi:hypothetical protein